MISMTLTEAAAALHGQLHHPPASQAQIFSGVCTDTRKMQGGELFVAIKGERVDAHELLEQARAQQACAAVVERLMPSTLTQIQVVSTRRALGHLAYAWRARHQLPLVAVTGSNGKTTVKEMIAAILRRRGAVLATRGNLNNDLGVPLTLFELGNTHRYAVIEMGANHPGEIAGLCEIARPHIGVITLCAPAHIEGFGSIEGVARAKGEILSTLPADGVAVLNADDAYFPLWQKLAGTRRQITFGMHAQAHVRATNVSRGDQDSSFDLQLPGESLRVTLPLAGQHNIQNALAATAATHALGLPVAEIARGLRELTAVHGRLEFTGGIRGCRVIDDTYNANPSSLYAALEVLSSQPGEHWLVLGDMGELGAEAERYHAEAGAHARATGVRRLFTVGELTRSSIHRFGEGAQHFPQHDALAGLLRAQLHAGVTVLVKGSRAMHMEKIIAAIQAPAASGSEDQSC